MISDINIIYIGILVGKIDSLQTQKPPLTCPYLVLKQYFDLSFTILPIYSIYSQNQVNIIDEPSKRKSGTEIKRG